MLIYKPSSLSLWRAVRQCPCGQPALSLSSDRAHACLGAEGRQPGPRLGQGLGSSLQAWVASLPPPGASEESGGYTGIFDVVS